jgi:hypothetical protein
MSSLVELQNNEWIPPISTELKTYALTSLENGSILYLPNLAFQLLPHEEEFLSPNYVDPKVKNISFEPHSGVLRCAKCSSEKYQALKNMLQRFSDNAEQFIRKLFPSYTPALQLGRTSFRPVEISGRISSYRKDDTRLHVDAFPSSPNQGRRILRVFANINPYGQARHWRIGESFLNVAKKFLPQTSKQWPGTASLLKYLKITKSMRTAYDHIMLQIHDRMKADLNYQKAVSQENIYFPSNTSWIVQTDEISHAAMSGQHLLEQTFYLPVNAMFNPERSPLRILEKLTGRVLT